MLKTKQMKMNALRFSKTTMKKCCDKMLIIMMLTSFYGLCFSLSLCILWMTIKTFVAPKKIRKSRMRQIQVEKHSYVLWIYKYTNFYRAEQTSTYAMHQYSPFLPLSTGTWKMLIKHAKKMLNNVYKRVK